MEMGISWSPGSQPCSGRTPRSCQVLEFLLCEGVWASGRGGQDSLPGGKVLALSVCFHSLELCAQHAAGQDTQAVSIACH